MLQGKTSLFDGRYNRLDSALFCTILFLCLFRISNYAICHFICHNYAKWVISWQRCSVAAMQWKRDAGFLAMEMTQNFQETRLIIRVERGRVLKCGVGDVGGKEDTEMR